MKSAKKKIEEGRCQGFGPDYVPFLKANEARSWGTSAMISDPFEGRYVHTLSQTETEFYWNIRGDRSILHICEQYLLEHERMNEVRRKIGLPEDGLYYTTDFLIYYRDGSRHAYSIKSSATLFDIQNCADKEKRKKYDHLITRQLIEKMYWESQGVFFSIVTMENINRTLAANMMMVMSCWDSMRVCNENQKVLWLIAHGKVDPMGDLGIDMEKVRVTPRMLFKAAQFDVNDLYERIHEKKED